MPGAEPPLLSRSVLCIAPSRRSLGAPLLEALATEGARALHARPGPRAVASLRWFGADVVLCAARDSDFALVRREARALAQVPLLVALVSEDCSRFPDDFDIVIPFRTAMGARVVRIVRTAFERRALYLAERARHR